ncbi:hypothetical protein FOL47_004277, partial [Perkinsus chesapeaki]
IEHHQVLPYHPQANGIAEKAVGVIKDYMKKFPQSFAWDQALALSQYYYNHCHETVLMKLEYLRFKTFADVIWMNVVISVLSALQETTPVSPRRQILMHPNWPMALR